MKKWQRTSPEEEKEDDTRKVSVPVHFMLLRLRLLVFYIVQCAEVLKTLYDKMRLTFLNGSSC